MIGIFKCFHFIFWLVGAAVIAIAAWMILDPTFQISMTNDENNYRICIYIFLAAGVLMIILAFLDSCGAYKESQCILILRSCFLLVILVAEVTAFVWAHTKLDDLQIKIRVMHTVQKEYSVVDSCTQAFDVIQKQLQCCGGNGPRDWRVSAYNMKNPVQIVAAAIDNYKIPRSCCREGIYDELCTKYTIELRFDHINKEVVYVQGCMDKLITVIKSHMNIVRGITIAVIAVEVAGIIFSLVLCFANKRSIEKRDTTIIESALQSSVTFQARSVV